MKAAVKPAFSVEKFLALPEVKPPLEFFGGRTIQKMSPRMPHALIQGEFLVRMHGYSRPLKLGRVFPELRCTFGGNSYVFDLSFFVQSRMPAPMSDEVTIPPDLAIEILSPGQTVGELSRKLRSAIRRGTKLGWFIHPYQRYVVEFRSDAKPKKIQEGETLILDEVLPGFRLAIAEIFGWLDEE